MARSSTTWVKGERGNKSGVRKGEGRVAKLRKLLDPHSDELVMKAKDMAISGDTVALRLCLERLVPPIRIKDEPVHIPGLDASQGIASQGRAIIEALGSGEITPMEAASVMQSVANQARIIEVSELEERITALESKSDTEA